MKSVQLFKLLQKHAGKINNLATRLYNADIETQEAFDAAFEEVERAYDLMRQEKQKTD